jgi:iron complex outermembrane receptor protein
MKKIALLVSGAISTLAYQHAAFADNAPIEIDTITVTADPLGDRTEDELISAVTVLTGAELDNKKATTLGETLDGLAGVTNADFGPGSGRPVIRGLQGSRVQTLNNGLKLSDISGEGADHTVAIDPHHAEQIEVIRGPATLLYGGNAAGGVINVINKDLSPAFSDKTELNGQLGYGENGNQRLGNLHITAPISDSLVVRSSYSGQRSDDIDIDGFQETDQTSGKKGTLQNSAVENDSFSLSSVYVQDWGFVGLGYTRWETEYGLPEVFLGQGAEEYETIQAEYDRFDLRSEFYDPMPGFHTARVKLSYTDYAQAEIGSAFTDGNLDESETELVFNNDETEARVELLHDPIQDWNGVVGLQLSHRDLSTNSASEDDGHGHGNFYVRDNTTRSLGLFILENKDVSFGSIKLTARIDYVNSNPSSLANNRDINMGLLKFKQNTHIHDREFTPISLSAGTILPLNDEYHIRLGLSRSERAPSPEQLYAWGEHHAAGTIELGNPNLGKETYTNLDIGLDKHLGDFTYNLTAFYNQVNDYIYLETQQDAGVVIVDDEGNVLVKNSQDDAIFYGAEFTSAWQISDTTRVRFSGDYVRAKLDSGENLPRISPARVGLGFDTSLNQVALSMDFRHVFEQNETAELESDTDGYNLVSFDANWAPSSLNGFSFYLKGRNLLNEDGRHHQSFLKDSAPIKGRSLYAGINFDFSL